MFSRYTYQHFIFKFIIHFVLLNKPYFLVHLVHISDINNYYYKDVSINEKNLLLEDLGQRKNMCVNFC